MAYTVGQAKSDLAGHLDGSSLARVSGVYDVMREAAGSVLLNCSPSGTRRVAQISNALHPGVYTYLLPVDIRDGGIIDVRPQVNRQTSDQYSIINSREFDIYKGSDFNKLAVSYNDGTATLKLPVRKGTSTIFDNFSDYTEYTRGVDLGNITNSTLNKLSGNAIRFDLDGATTSGYIENTLAVSFDLTDKADVGSFFVWLYQPSDSISQIELRVGNDGSNYDTMTATSSHDNTSFKIGWNLVRFDWSSSVETGAVNNTAIDYYRITFTYNGDAATAFVLDEMSVSVGYMAEIEYYSTYLFKNTTGTFLQTPTLDTDIVNLSDTSSYNLFLYECARIAHWRLRSFETSNSYKSQLMEDYAKYNNVNPEDSINNFTYYYRQ